LSEGEEKAALAEALRVLEEDKLGARHEILDRLGRIERRLPDSEGEFPIDRHLREIRDRISDGFIQIDEIFYKKRNGGRDVVVTGLNRVEDRVNTVMKILLAMFTAFVLGTGGILFMVLAEKVVSIHPR
jgi:chemotaxis regulatin CheY-phosphate phosphatase CheZ